MKSNARSKKIVRLETMTKRDKLILEAALTYALGNIDSLNDAFAHFTGNEPDNMGGRVRVGKSIADSFDESEISKLLERFMAV